MARVQQITEAVFGPVAAEIEAHLEKAREVDRESHPDQEERLFSQAYDLYVSAYERYLNAPPGKYNHLVTWKYEYTLHGTSRPTVDEALWEAYWLSLWHEYGECLRDMVGRRDASAEYAEKRLQEVEAFYEKVFQRAALTLRESLWIEDRLDNARDPIRDTYFYRREVLKDPNLQDV